MQLAEMSDEQIRDAIKENGSVSATAAALKVSRTGLRRRIDRSGIITKKVALVPQNGASAKQTVTREALQDAISTALQPPNNCKVKAFLDGLDDESRAAVEDALDCSQDEIPGGILRNSLLSLGLENVPGTAAIADHRAGRRPCRCKG